VEHGFLAAGFTVTMFAVLQSIAIVFGWIV
jgi:hypothetical protein